MKSICNRHTVSFILLLTLLLPAGMTTQAAAPTSPAQFDCANVTEIPQAECEALVALYESTNGDNWTNNTDWLATNTPCSWFGITCWEGELIELSLNNNQLNGTIPPEISNLAALRILSLAGNQLRGPIPPEIGDLTKLMGLYLARNQLSGPIPSEIGNLNLGGFIFSRPQSLDLSYNQLSGPIPPEIGNFRGLQGLNLSNNQLSGSIPSEIGNLVWLPYLSLSNNQLSGPIPTEIGSLVELVRFSLSGNQLSGSIPSEIGNLSALKELDLSRNQLSGSIPPEIGDLPALEHLVLNHNQLNESIPYEIGNLAMLKRLELGSNQLGGAVPSSIGNLSALTSLLLSSNRLTSLPSEIGDLIGLWVLVLGDNPWIELPAEIGNLSNLTALALSDIQLISLPSWIENLTALTTLTLHNNQINDLPSTIGDLTMLQYLTLHNNSLDGEIPPFLTSLTQLGTFTFHGTEWCVPSIDGNISAWLSTIPNLYGTGLICGQDLGSLSGVVKLTDTNPIIGMQVNLYRSALSPQWQHLTTTHTTADGTYQFTGLGQGLGIDYRVQFVDPTHQLTPQYYDAKPSIATADVITITPGIPRTGIDAVLALPQPPVVEVATDTGSVAYNPDGTAQITMPAPNPSDITVTRAVTCAVGAPSAVTLTLSTGPQYAMANVSSNLYRATIPAAALTGNATLAVVAVCSEGTSTTTVGYITLYDPSGYVTDAQTGDPVESATVTLYNVPGWLPKTGPDDDRLNTCESNLSKAADAPWSQPAPTALGIIANADVTPTTPKLPFQHTTVAGYYGWDVPQGCWYVTVEAEGYASLTSPVVGVPPAVTDLNLTLTPLSTPCTPLTNVGIVGPLSVTGTLYIGTSYTFQAVITPTDATLPITYTWTPAPQTGQGTAQATYRWNTPDTYTVTLKAENCGGSVTITREFVIEAKDMFMVYLPLVLRGN